MKGRLQVRQIPVAGAAAADPDRGIFQPSVEQHNGFIHWLQTASTVS